MRRVAPWVDWRKTCDGFKYGDPDMEVKGIAVAWQSTLAALEEAYQQGCNLFITHEPTFYSHMDDDQALKMSAPGKRKQAFLERTGMVVYRCHDAWDTFPKIGILDAWSAFLGFEGARVKKGYYCVHDIPPMMAWELTTYIARKILPLGEREVRFIGKRSATVKRLAIGTGAITDVREMVALGADAVLATDDGVVLWRDAAWMGDAGIPLLVVDHCTAEIPGLRNLAKFLEEKFHLPTWFVGPTCLYEDYVAEQYRDQDIRMRRDDLGNLPPVILPRGYVLRPMKAGEEWAYLAVMNASIFAGEADRAWFEKQFSGDPRFRPEHLLLIWKGEKPVAAAAAWHRIVRGEAWGMVHWVGVDRTERRKGLGKAIVLAVLHRLRERGFYRAMLDTQSWRLPAIATYLSLGFKPWPSANVPFSRWQGILRELGYADVTS